MLRIANSTLSGNAASQRGGGLFLSSADTDLVASTISGNSAGTDGAGIAVTDGHLDVLSVTVAKNSASGNGGGLAVWQTAASADFIVSLSNSTVAANTATGSGGGLYTPLYGNTTTLQAISTIIAKNKAGAGDDVSGTIAASHDLIQATTGLLLFAGYGEYNRRGSAARRARKPWRPESDHAHFS